jgi:phenylalanyl-tRNA synthetase beta chain
MLISFNWLKKYIKLADSTTSEEVAQKLMMSTVEVEKITKQGEHLENVVVGKITKIEKHPEADKLNLCTVDLGAEQLVLVCGGSNVAEGLLVAVAKVGARVRWHGEGELITLQPAVIRGVESKGMICGADEIGLSDMFPKKSEKEILDLTHLKVKPGISLAEALGLNDTIFEIDNKSLSNRPDLWGHYGIAREIAALFNRQVADYKTKTIKLKQEKELSVEVLDKKDCVRYRSVMISGVRVEASPRWLQEALNSVGVHSVNNIVDATNYVMFDLGQPLHAFDAEKIDGPVDSKKIIVRKASEGEKLKLLDGSEKVLTPDVLVIADQKKALAVAGVMGGEESAISEKTTSIVIESACFEASSIRHTSSSLHLRTDASVRFEKGLDQELTETALNKVVELILDICPTAKVVSTVVEVVSSVKKKNVVSIPLSFFEKKLGVVIAKKTIVSILERLGFVVVDKKEVLNIEVPTWRGKDVLIAEDIVEEVIRIYGYDKVPGSLPTVELSEPPVNSMERWQRLLQDVAVYQRGFSEIYNYSFVSGSQISALNEDLSIYIELDNPLSKEKPYLRRNLAINLLENAARAIHEEPTLKLFEIGKVYRIEEAGMKEKLQSDVLLPRQDNYFAALFSEKKNSEPFKKLRLLLEDISVACGSKFVLKAPAQILNYAHPTRSASIFAGDVEVGLLYEIHPEVGEKIGIDQRVAILELNLSALSEMDLFKSVKFEPIASYPEALRDVAFWIQEKYGYEEIENAILETDELVKKVELFDVYRSKEKESEKSIAVHITYLDKNKTLETKEIDTITQKIKKQLELRFGVKFRD